MLLTALIGFTGGAARAADPAGPPALEWIAGADARARIEASEGVVFVDLYAHSTEASVSGSCRS